MDVILQRLYALQDRGYREFTARLIPNISFKAIIGVRTPALRVLAGELHGSPEAEAFMRELPHTYYEENNLHAFLLERIRDFGLCLAAVDAFLPYVDNWATCDSLSPKVFARHLPALRAHIPGYLASGRAYTVRFGLGLLMKHFLDGAFDESCLALAAAVRSKEYYVNMMVSWFFATALAKQYAAALPYLTENRLPVWTHNKTLQKAVESFRLTQAQKDLLKTLKRK